jgi:hypothetical protein
LTLPATFPPQSAHSLPASAQQAPADPTGPQPPCAREPIPPYPALADAASIQSWSKSEFGRDWIPPACTGWTETGFTTLITASARFSHTSESSDLLRRVGAISALTGMKYWSVTHKRWQTLIVDSHALTDADPHHRRADFTPAEMTAGQVLYFEQADNLSGKAVYRMHIVEASDNRIVFEVENVNTIRYFFIPVLHPGEVQSMYFLDRESVNLWQYYAIVRTKKTANGLIAGNQSSAINRAAAFYRHLSGIPDTQEPPAAP